MTGDKYRWVAYTRDGGSVSQVAQSGTKNAYENLPHDNIKSFELWDWRTGVRVLLVTFKQGEKLVWRRRTAITPGGISEVCHVIGKLGDTYKGIIGIYESDGRIETVDEFLPNSEWFYPPQLKQKEKVKENELRPA